MNAVLALRFFLMPRPQGCILTFSAAILKFPLFPLHSHTSLDNWFVVSAKHKGNDNQRIQREQETIQARAGFETMRFGRLSAALLSSVGHDDEEMNERGEPLLNNAASTNKTSARQRLLTDIMAKQREIFITDLFSLVATVMRDRVGKIQQQSDTAWDTVVRVKDLQIFVFSAFGVACNVAIASVFWYNDKVVYSASGVRQREDILLEEASDGRKVLLYTLQLLLSITTVAACLLIIQKYLLLLEEKRRAWSNVDTYTLQAVENKEEGERLEEKFESSYSFFRSPLRWSLCGELIVTAVHPMIWLNRPETKTFYEVLEVFIFLRLYLVLKLTYSFSQPYKARHDIVASNADLQRSGFQITIASTSKMLFFKYPARFTLSVLVGTLSTLGFIVFILERRFQPEVDKFGRLENALWFTFVTFSTVGYGDLSPQSAFGRLASIAVGASGIAITTIFGGIVTQLMKQSREERYISEYLNVATASHQCRDSAALAIQAAWRHYRQRNGTIKTPWLEVGHKSNLVYAAIKRLRSHRWVMSQSLSSASDPVIDSHLTRLTTDLLASVRLLEKHEKAISAAHNNIDGYVDDIKRVLDDSRCV